MKIISGFIDIITFRPYLHKNWSPNIGDDLSKNSSDYSKYLITLSTSSIALTFAILQLLYNNIVIRNIIFIRISWYLFTATILLGLIFYLLDILRMFFNLNLKRISSVSEKLSNEKLEDLSISYKTSFAMARWSYLVLVLQTVLLC